MTAYYNEIEPYAAEWLRSLIKAGLIADGEVDTRSIIDVQADDLRGFTQCHFFAGIGGWSYALRLAGWPDDRPVWTGSCPCQPFSSCGEKNGQQDERHLWPHFARLIREHRPTTLFGEQVDEAIGWGWADEVAADLEAEDYAFASSVLSSHIVGGSFAGERLYFAAQALGQRLQGPREHGRSINQAADGFREADPFIDALQRSALPFVCAWHDGVPVRMAHVACRGAGNAIVPKLAAEFISAFIEAEQ